MAEIRVLNSVGATVIIDGVERESVTVDAGTTVHWKVSKEGYVTQEGDYTVLEDTVLPVVLKREEYEITFVVSPADADFSAFVPGGTSKSQKVDEGVYTLAVKWNDIVEWTCERDGYIKQSRIFTATQSETIYVTLEEEVVEDPDRTITFIVSPKDATLKVMKNYAGDYEATLNDGVYTMTAKDGDVIGYYCTKDGYDGKSGTFTVNGDETITIALEEEGVENPDRTITFNVTPTDATLTVNGEEVTLTDGVYVMTAKDGDEIKWMCEKDGYISQDGKHTVDGDATITIALEEVVVEHYITVEPTSLELAANPRLLDENVTVSSDGSWTAAAAASWVTLSQTSGDAGETAILVSAERNDDTSARSTTVTITSEHGETATLNVSQNGTSSGGGGDTGGGTTYTYTVVNNTSGSVELGIYNSQGMIKLTVTVPANGTATLTTDEEITSETEFYVDGLLSTSYSVRLQDTTIYIDYGTSNSSDSDAQPSGDAEAYSEGGDGGSDELELSGE